MVGAETVSVLLIPVSLVPHTAQHIASAQKKKKKIKKRINDWGYEYESMGILDVSERDWLMEYLFRGWESGARERIQLV